MASAIPLKFEFDNTTPSSLAEFTAANTVSVINGGTGVSSLELLGASLSSIDLSSTWVSATNITATNVSATTVSSTYGLFEHGVSANSVSATLVSSLDISAGYMYTAGGVSSIGSDGNFVGMRRIVGATYPNLIQANEGTLTLQAEDDVHLKANNGEDFARFNENAAVWLYYNNTKVFETQTDGVIINTSLSSTAITGADSMPLPAPFGYVQTDTDGTDSTSELNFGTGADTTNIVSNSDDITWNDTDKEFNVLKAGTYEVFANNVLDSGTQSDLINITILKNGSDVMSISPRCFGNHGPFTRTILGVTTAAAADTLTVSIDPQTGPKTVTLKTGSSMTVKRLK